MADEVVVITGASGGIGAALAWELARRGKRTVLAARRDRELREAAQRCTQPSHAVVADVTRRADVERILAEALKAFGRVDAWVNNAGRGISRPVLELTDEDVDEMFRVNVKSALYGMQVAAAHFKKQGKGHIINVSSMLGRIPFASPRSAYSAAKHALNALSAQLRVDLRATHPGIQVTTVYPGVVATEFGVRALGGGMDSRKFPGAQSAEEVASMMADLLDAPRAELYTRSEYKEQVRKYYSADDVAVLEALPPFAAGPPRT